MLENLDRWEDIYYMIHVDPQFSESINGMLFTCEMLLLKAELGTLTNVDRHKFKRMVEAHKISEGVYSQTPWDKKDPASHDNITGLVATSIRLGLNYHLTLKIKGHYWHPRDLIYYTYCKTGRLKFLLPLLCLIQMISCFKRYKKRPHGKFIHTDGKLLTLCRCLGLKKELKKCLDICTRIIKRHHLIPDPQKSGELVSIDTWDKVFRFYFKRPDHPNNLLADKLFSQSNPTTAHHI